jgi:alpha-tubulin suppressor-like RCC1 family protein
MRAGVVGRRLVGALGCLFASSCGDATGPSADPSEATHQALTLGGTLSCGIVRDGRTYCWGGNTNGQLGNGSRASTTVPVLVAGTEMFKAISSSDRTVCALTTAGRAWCWGTRPSASAATADSPTPTEITSPEPFTALTAGLRFACGLTASGAAYCWGLNTFGQVGTGSVSIGDGIATPTAVSGDLRFTAISAGLLHVCALTGAGKAYCWGDGSTGALGNGGSSISATPTQVVGGVTFASIAAGAGYTCGVSTTGAGYCWGINGSGQLGNGSSEGSVVPLRISGDLTLASIRPSRGNSIFLHTCAITTSRRAYCWGWNVAGEVGPASAATCPGVGTTPTIPCVLTPAPVTGLGDVMAIDLGTQHTCAILRTHAMHCWGSNATGQLGDGTTTSRNTPAPTKGDLVFP